MPPRKSPRDLTAPDLVRQWKAIVNNHVNIGRDAHFMKDALLKYTPVQILLGMYRLKGFVSVSSITIPMFTRLLPTVVENDEVLAEIALAIHISNFTPPEFFIYEDLAEEESSYAFQKSLEARLKLREWADGILS